MSQDEGQENWLLELQVRYENTSATALKFDSEIAQLKTDSGKRIPEFFLAFQPIPEVAPKREDTVDLRYWIAPQDRTRTSGFLSWANE